MASKFHELAVDDVEQLTKHSVAIRFSVPAELEEDYAFLPGQYLTLRATIGGQDLRRSYSICATPKDGLRVGIKRVPEGRFSTFAQALKPGDRLQVMTPEGRFVCETNPGEARQFLMISAGSGITPVLSIMRSVLEDEPQSVVTLVYGNQTTGSIMFRTELEDLKDRFLERFHVHHVLSRENQDVELFSGRIDVDRIKKMAEKGIIDPAGADGVYLCGPSGMTFALNEHFENSGIEMAKVHTELFEAPDDASPLVVEAATIEAIEKGVGVEVVLDGITRTFDITDTKDTVLQGAVKSGLDLPFSCKGGMCATCRCKVVEGEASMDRNFALDKWELEAGFVLACQSRPKSERLVLDFDAA